jgi:hypothetical protein
MGAFVETLWLAGAAVTSAVVIVGRALWQRASLRETEVVHVRVACPLDGDRYQCRIEREVDSGRWIEVKACSAYPRGCLATCGQTCARLQNWGVPVGRLRQTHAVPTPRPAGGRNGVCRTSG